jgi:hypothetical protein
MASTITTIADGFQPVVNLGTQFSVIQKEIDFSETNGGNGDTIECLPIAANTYVQNVGVIVKTAEGGTATATVGDGTDPNGWDASTNLNATAGTVTLGLPGTDAYATAGKFYTAADTIDLVLGNACDAAKVIVFATIVNIEDYA